MKHRPKPPDAQITVKRHGALTLALLAFYVGDVALDYHLERQWWTTCPKEAYSDSLLTTLVSGPLLFAALIVHGRFKPGWLWVASIVAALPIGYGICLYVDDLASSGTWVVCP